MRAGRLLSILLTLQARGRATAAELAAELEVSPRTIHRDMEALSMAGVPVYAERGPHGGWLLSADYRSGPRGLDADELRALFLATPGTVLGDLTKLLLALPADDRARWAQVRQKVLVDASTWRASQPEPVPCLASLYDALRRDRQVRLRYARADSGSPADRLVSPLGLVAKGPVWYLVAAVGDEPRTYRVSRVVSVQPTDQPVTPPPGFDLEQFWERSKARLVAGVPRFAVRVRAHHSIVGGLASRARWARLTTVQPADATGWSVVEMEFELEEDACSFALSAGPCLELLEPGHLRLRVAEQARAMAELYRP
jgi:predicted DNA-binding transcriptional regulator YafY